MVTVERKIQRGEFSNEPFVNFSMPENRRAMEDALKKVAGELGREYPLYIAGEKITTPEKMTLINRSHPNQEVGIFQKATIELANRSVDVANRTFERWKRMPLEERAKSLLRASGDIGHGNL